MRNLDWELVEYRPGRYVKLSGDGQVLGKATEEEVSAWFGQRGWPLHDKVARTREGSPAGRVAPPKRGTGPAPDELASSLSERAAVVDEQVAVTAEPSEESRPVFAAGAAKVPSPPELPLEIPEGQALMSSVKPVAQEVSPAVEEAVTPSEPVTEPREAAEAVAALERPLEVSQSMSATEAGIGAKPSVGLREPSRQRTTAPSVGPFPAGLEPMGESRDKPDGEQAARRPQDSSDDAGIASDKDPDANTEPADAAEWWLWVDPRVEPGFSPASFDDGAFLQRAAQRFASKGWARGRSPGRLAIHPDQSTESLSAAAEALGIEILMDARVSLGTYMLGLADEETAEG